MKQTCTEHHSERTRGAISFIPNKKHRTQRILWRKAMSAMDESYMYCSVVFPHGSYSYYYLSEDTNIQIGDHVLVPAGPQNRKVVVEVVDIEYCMEGEEPYPFEQTKWIIRRCENQKEKAEKQRKTRKAGDNYAITLLRRIKYRILRAIIR